MGPGLRPWERDLPEVPGVDCAPDYVAEMAELAAGHPTLVHLKPLPGTAGPHAATWLADDGPRTEKRDTLRELVLYLRAELGSR
jgi:hypothetical protein